MRGLVKCGTALALVMMLNHSCAMQSFANKSKPSGEARDDEARDLRDDSNRPFVPLLAGTHDIKVVELWQPTGSSSTWTPEGDAVSYAGRGAIINFEAKTIQFVTKNAMEDRELSSPHQLSAGLWAKWLREFSALNRVEEQGGSHRCSAHSLEAQTHLDIRRRQARQFVLDYRKASCLAAYSDTPSFERLFAWLGDHGAPWID